jgi:hypothetical protein
LLGFASEELDDFVARGFKSFNGFGHMGSVPGSVGQLVALIGV